MRSTADSLLIYYFTMRSHQQIPIHLTPQNAESFGYAWVKDISLSAETICIENICYLLDEEGYELGQVADEKNDLICYGIYMPLLSSAAKKPKRKSTKKIPAVSV